jgi:predicted Zn finger-like uncharacterized protein
MLVTTCKHCAARFRVTPEQLNLRQGQVRCGQCQEVFNGFESLERFPGDDTGARLLAARAAKSPPHDILEDLGNSDFGTRLRPAAAAPATGPGSEPPRSPELTDIPPLPEVPDLVVEAGEAKADFETEAPSLTLADLPPAAAPQGEAAPQPDPMLAVAALENSIAAAAPTRVSRAWSFGVALAALILGLQLAYAWRARLAQQYPDLRPILEAACAKAGCSVPWVNDELALKLEDSELLEVPGKPGQIALQARIRNLSPAAQEFPHLELTLTDVTGQTAVRRVLRPADYLGRTLYPGEVMAGASEVLVSVRLETTRIRPTGYELLLFYP